MGGTNSVYNSQQGAPTSLGNGSMFSNMPPQGLGGNMNTGINNMQQTANYYPSIPSAGGFANSTDTGNNGLHSNVSNLNSGSYQQPQTQSQMQAMQPQSTGYYNVPFQQPMLQHPQMTGMPLSQQQTQQTQQTGLQPQHTGYGQLPETQNTLLPQQTGFYAQTSQQPLEPLKPTATGFVNSFANNGINSDIKIPVRRLSFITANDQAKFEKLFRSMVPRGSNTISGNDCRKVLIKSGLQPSQLARIWALCDSSKAGALLFPEFALAMHLVNTVLQGDSIPYEFDTKTKNEISGFIDAINLSIAAESTTDLPNTRTPFDDLLSAGLSNVQPQGTGIMPQTSFGIPLQSQTTGSAMINSAATGYMPQTSFGAPGQMTGSALNNFQAPLQPHNTGYLSQSLNAPSNVQTTGAGIINPQNTGGFAQGYSNQMNGNMSALQPQSTGGFTAATQSYPTVNPSLQPQSTGGHVAGTQIYPTVNSSVQPQLTGGFSQGLQPQLTGNNSSNFQQQTTGMFSNLKPQNTGSFGSSISAIPITQQLQPTSFNSDWQQQNTGTLQQQSTGGFSSLLPPQMRANIAMQQPQATGGPPNVSFQQQSTGGYFPNLSVGSGSAPMVNQPQQTGNMFPLQNQQTGFLPASGFNPTKPLTAQKTGFGNNEIYSQSNFGSNFTAQTEDSITDEEKSLFYKVFETYDKENRGLLDASSAVEIFRKSGLNRTDLETIWALCDINNNGQLNKQEFALGMHLVYRKLNGFQLPSRLPLNLIPSSRKILDNVKDQLKNVRAEDDKKNVTKTDALSYKNNDDEEVLPSFRNRRKVFNTTAANFSPSSSPVSTPTQHKEVPKLQINRNKERGEQLYKAIAEKKQLIRGQRARKLTPSTDDFDRIEVLKGKIRAFERASDVQNASVPSELKAKFDSFMQKLPNVFYRINEVDSAISAAKIEIFRQKNPSCLVGSGPNGEITEDDKRKAKSKALLKSRMDALTGKVSSANDSFEAKEAQYNAEIAKIKSESSKNLEIIADIRRSIAELSASLTTSLNGGTVSNRAADFEKWELGAGLEPDVGSFINDLRSTSSAQHFQEEAKINSQQQQAVSSHRNTAQNYPNYTSEPERQISSREVGAQVRGADDRSMKKSDNAEDDAEERQLQEELNRLKLKKKEEKEKRLAELRRQIEAAQAESSDDEGAESVPIYKSVGGQNTVPLNDSRTSVLNVQSQHSSANVAPTGTGGPNPFFKQSGSTTSSFDSRAAEVQRRLQRGLDHNDDDDWSDGEPENQKLPASSTIKVEENATSKKSFQPDSTAISSPVLSTAVPYVSSNENVVAKVSSPVPIAPPIPQVGSTSAPPVPIAPPLPQVGSNQETPVPIAPMPPAADKFVEVEPTSAASSSTQTNAPSSFMAPPPLLPTNQAQTASGEESGGDDSDDLLSIPDSVASEDHGAPPSGIPPPPPLPSM